MADQGLIYTPHKCVDKSKPKSPPSGTTTNGKEVSGGQAIISRTKSSNQVDEVTFDRTKLGKKSS